MRSHSEIIAAASDLPKLADRLGVSIHTVRSWGQRNSVPGEYWPGLVGEKLATVEELLRSMPKRARKAA